MFLAALDQTIVGPALAADRHRARGADYYTWVVTIFLLTSTVTVPIYGKLSDLYGRKPMLMIGITLFLIGSGPLRPEPDHVELVLFRGIQGLGAGALFPIALAVIGDLFTPAERGKYQGLFGAVFGISFLVGPALGGFLTDKYQLALGLLRQPAHRARRASSSSGACYRRSSGPRQPQVRLRLDRRLHDRDHFLSRRPGPDQLIGMTLGERFVDRHPGLGHHRGRSRVPYRSSSCSWNRGRSKPIVPLHLFRIRTYGPRWSRLPRDLRVRGGDHLPAALLPGRARRQRDRLRLRDLPFLYRAHRQLDQSAGDRFRRPVSYKVLIIIGGSSS